MSSSALTLQAPAKPLQLAVQLACTWATQLLTAGCSTVTEALHCRLQAQHNTTARGHISNLQSTLQGANLPGPMFIPANEALHCRLQSQHKLCYTTQQQGRLFQIFSLILKEQIHQGLCSFRPMRPCRLQSQHTAKHSQDSTAHVCCLQGGDRERTTRLQLATRNEQHHSLSPSPTRLEHGVEPVEEVQSRDDCKAPQNDNRSASLEAWGWECKINEQM